jgi:hypothetical protein
MGNEKKIRVLVVDDSLVSREMVIRGISPIRTLKWRALR